MRSRTHPGDHLIVVFLAPPWADALRPDRGLHLDRTKPPILEIVHDFEQVYGAQPVLSLDFNMVFFSAPADGRDK